jgi:hypothetical protein
MCSSRTQKRETLFTVAKNRNDLKPQIVESAVVVGKVKNLKKKS